MIIELCGGEPSNVVQAGEIPNHGRSYKVDTARIESLVGMAIPPHKQLNILENLGFVIKGDTASVPSWRPDIQGEADLVEYLLQSYRVYRFLELLMQSLNLY